MAIRKSLRISLAVFLAPNSCLGSAPNPVLRYTPGDEKRSCTSLKAEIASNEVELIQLASDKTSTVTTNVVLGVTGFLLIVPWFFMDLKGKEAGEIDALRHRNRNLRQFAAGKEECHVPESKVKFEGKPAEAAKPDQSSN